MGKALSLSLIIMLSLPANAAWADFFYGHYDLLLKHHVKTGITINDIRLNAVDYEALSREVKRSESDYNILLRELAAFDTALLKNREEKIAFWINCLQHRLNEDNC